MSREIHSGVGGQAVGDGSARSLSTMNLITLSWLLASGQASVLPNIDAGKCLDLAVHRTGHAHDCLR